MLFPGIMRQHLGSNTWDFSTFGIRDLYLWPFQLSFLPSLYLYEYRFIPTIAESQQEVGKVLLEIKYIYSLRISFGWDCVT
jgi:hypothetical protein